MMIGDLLEATAHLASSEIAKLDAHFSEANLPTISEIRQRFDKHIKRVLTRGAIKTETEYYAVRGAVKGSVSSFETERLWAIVDAFEQKLDKRSLKTPPF